MKNVAIIGLAVLLFGLHSCGTPEGRAQKMIKRHLKENLDDPKSYEPVSFSGLDTAIVVYLGRAPGEKDRIVPKGWRMDHKYRAKNKMGALVLTEDTFYFDWDVREISE